MALPWAFHPTHTLSSLGFPFHIKKTRELSWYMRNYGSNPTVEQSPPKSNKTLKKAEKHHFKDLEFPWLGIGMLHSWNEVSPWLSLKCDALLTLYFSIKEDSIQVAICLYRNHLFQLFSFQNVSQAPFPWLILLLMPTDPPNQEHCTSSYPGLPQWLQL